MEARVDVRTAAYEVDMLLTERGSFTFRSNDTSYLRPASLVVV